ncbi:uncharacterized protein tbc1d10c [Corythoichthys intestinalis]|uniref:uncharacterized protein tbc1d10c n=1 Tax=Corythoichthys intestinalis TaxID=161448 RepID=UPI0025A55EAD|nr:uncharacterized protein tbc1d10c [Corythoichthys intestinalis]
MKQAGHTRSEMLRPSSRTNLKTVSDEDSSGSGAGSEVSPELETDRFGFIVPSGSEAGFVGPHPQLVRQREAKWINIMDQWQSILLKKTNMVKVQCQKGIPTSLRAKCWPLLCGATNRMKHNKQLFQSLDSQVALQKWVDIINRDLDRQFPFHEMFLSKDGHGQQGLFRVLKAYTQYQPEEGYCQAQGPVAAVLLMNMPAEEAFWCLVQISENYLPGYYSPLLEGVLFDATVLTWVLKKTCPSVHKHLQLHEVEPLMFATDWLMCLFTRHLPFNTLLRVWDLFFCKGVRVLLQVAVVLVRRVLGQAGQRKQCQGQMETLQRLRDVRCEVQKEDNAFIEEVCAVPLSSTDLKKHTEKALAKWRKDRPSSTFDPRGRCHGYRVAWERVQLNQAELDKNERETGNLSAPLARSASCLSLSPSLLQKRWRKGGDVRIQGVGRGVSRHCSMGANDWQSCYELNLQFIREDKGIKRQRDPYKKKQTVKELRKTTLSPVEQHIALRLHSSNQNLEEIEVTRSLPNQRAEIDLNQDALPSEAEVTNLAKMHMVDEIALCEGPTQSELVQNKSIGDVVMVTDRKSSESLAEIDITPTSHETQADDVIGNHITEEQPLDAVQNCAMLYCTNTTFKSPNQCTQQLITSEVCSLCCQTESNNKMTKNQTHEEITPLLEQACLTGTPLLSGDIRKSSSSHGLKLTRRLAEDLFTNPSQSPCESKPPNVIAHQIKTEYAPAEPNQHANVFHKKPKKNTGKVAARIQVPTILIQDFSDVLGKLVEEENANTRERRWWWRRHEQEKRGKDEENLRTKTAKEVIKGKEKERKKPQTRGKSFQVQKDNMKFSPSYAEAYF